MRLLELPDWPEPAGGLEAKPVIGGLLVQDRDEVSETAEQMTVMSAKQPTEAEWQDMRFAWQVCRHVRSNAIVIAREGATIGIGAGQMSRVDAVRIAIEKARAGEGDVGDVAGRAAREPSRRLASPAPRLPPTRSSRLRTDPSSRSTRV